MFSQRVLSIKQSPIRKFAPIRDKVTAQGINVIPLNIGQPDIKTPSVFFDAIKAIDPQNVIAYTESRGTDDILDAFSKYYKSHNADFEPEDFIITNGGSEALSYVFATLCDNEDEILVFSPYYANYNTIARLNEGKIVPILTKRENNFRIPPKNEIEKHITNKTKAILVTNPNNPTGLVLRKDEMQTIVDIAEKHNLYIISDEVYREFVYDGAEFISFMNFPNAVDRLIIVDSVSKRYSACGLRIGCIASKNKQLTDHIMKLCQARLCVPYVEQIGAAALINAGNQNIKQTVEEYRKRRDTVVSELKKIEGVECQTPEGAFYFIIKLPVKNAEEFTRWILEEFSYNNETILLCPASEFYAQNGKGADEVRISYCISQDELRRAMKILSEGLKKYKETIAG